MRSVGILYFFDACGFDTGLSPLSKNRIVANIIYLLHILSVVFFTLSQILNFDEFNSGFGLLEVVNNMVQYNVSLLTYWLMIFEACTQQRIHKHFWKKIQTNNDYFHPQLMSYNFKFIEFYSTTFLIWFTLCFISNFDAFFEVMAYLCLIKICQIRIFYYMLCLEVLYAQLQLIEKQFKFLSATVSKINSHSGELRRLRIFYQSVYELTTLLNEIFGWSQVAAVLFCFYALTTDLNFLFSHYQDCTPTYLICE